MRLKKTCGSSGWHLDSDLESMYTHYKQVIYSYIEFRKRAVTSRTTSQDKRIEEVVLSGDMEASTIRRIKYDETTRSQNRRIQIMLGKNKGTGVTEVTSVDRITQEVVTCTKKSEVE